jgi:hypothetical protein
MTSLGWRLVEALALQLSPAEREVALGDLIETQSTAWQATCEVFGLVARRQLQLWGSLVCPANSVPAVMRQTGMEGAWNGTREEAYTGADREPASAD